MFLPDQPVTTHAGNYTGRIFIVLWALTVSFMSCRNPKPEPTDDHPAYADSILKRTDSLLNSRCPRQSIAYLDSAYRAFPEAGPIDRWKKYALLYNYYLNYEPDTTKAGSYTDSSYRMNRQTEMITLVPYGSTRLRLTVFPKGNQ